MSEKILVGFLIESGEVCPVRVDTSTQEVFYEDPIGAPYLVTGIELASIPEADVVDDIDEAAKLLPSGCIGVISNGDGDKWFLSDDDRAYLVAGDAEDATNAKKVVGYDTCEEYADGEE